MILSLKNTIFLLLFAVFQVLLVFSFATSYEMIAVAGYILFLVVYFYIFNLRVVLDKKTLVLYLLFLIFSVFSLFFSHNLALSIENIVFSISTFLVFVFFHSAFSLNKIKKENLFITILIFMFAISFFFILTFLFSNLALFLPSLNLITLSYGHSHFSALLLLTLPIAWWFYYSKYSQIFKLKWFVVFFFYALTIFTFSRLALLLAVLSFPFLIKEFFFKNKKHKSIFLIVSLVIVLGISLISFYNGSCPTRDLKNQLCKPVSREIRPEYFKQSILSFLDQPITGYGPGTFPLITDRYSVVGKFGSVYAHNFFLQIFSENGLFAGIAVLLLMISFLKKALFKTHSNKYSLDYFLSISFILLLLNSLTDFDWNVFLTLQLTMIFVAGFLNVGRKGPQLLSSLWYVISSIVIFLGILTIIFKILLSDGYPNLAFKVFPYVHRQSTQIIKHKKLNKVTFNKMIDLYYFDSEVLFAALLQTENEIDKINLYKQIAIVSPWTSVNSSYLQLLNSQEMFEELGIVSYRGLELVEIASSKGYVSRYEVNQELATYLQESADYHLEQGDLETAIKYYKKIFEIETWTFHIKEPFFITDSNLGIKEVGAFLYEVEVDETAFGQNNYSFRKWFFKEFSNDINQLEPVDLVPFQKYFNIEEFWFLISQNIVEAKVSTKQWSVRLDWWYDFWLILIFNQNIHLDGKEYQYKLMNQLFKLGKTEKAEVVQKYLLLKYETK